ncbi:DUF1353 domain-containing protein [Nocardioides insulae]|uniref:DUF1353 domain-containing protein n=1 Tax=Nocardioides insulae TaxID=394734 RepID=UPI0003FFDD61|nr:DUF1353 domain-containing protein [Nocardioides insulae]
MDPNLRPQPERFFDGGDDTDPPAPEGSARIELSQAVDGDPTLFALHRRLGYRDEEYGEIVVPADLAAFRTDLTSVPSVFTWLVPKTGHHLAAALIHDALVLDRGEPAHLGAPIDRVGADRVFRRAMRDTRVGVVRRWLIWSAVTLATIWVGSGAWSRARHLRYLVVMVATLLLVAGIGVVATLDLFDVVDQLWWMGERAWWAEVIGGLSAAVVIPLLMGLTWGRFRVAGAIAGIALAVLLHVTAVLVVITLLYQWAERLARNRPTALLVTLGVVVAACGVLAVMFVGTA